VQKALLRIRQGVIKGSFSEFPRDLLDGPLKLGVLLLSNEIPIPLNYTGDVELRLESWGEIVVVTGASAELDLIGEPEYVEEFRPDRNGWTWRVPDASILECGGSPPLFALERPPTNAESSPAVGCGCLTLAF
jgi:hypothetical protein